MSDNLPYVFDLLHDIKRKCELVSILSDMLELIELIAEDNVKFDNELDDLVDVITTHINRRKYDTFWIF